MREPGGRETIGVPNPLAAGVRVMFTPPTLERQKEILVSRLSKTLAEFGVDLEPDAFVDMAVGLLGALYPAWSIDELLVRPREALRFCDAVRDSLKNHDLPDDIILRPVLNRRKHG